MKKNYIIALLLMLLCGASNAMADAYKVDFETTVDTSDHEFRVASGWSHIVDADINPYFTWLTSYVDYSYEENAGIDGTQALKVASQTLSGQEKFDLLVSPKLSGTVSIMVKSASEAEDQTAGIKFFVVDNGTMGAEITPAEAPALTKDGYVKYVLPEQSGANIGIRGEYVYIDDFEAASAEITMTKSFAVVGAKVADDANTTTELDNSGWYPQQVTYINCDAEGKYTLSYDIDLKNTGDLTLEPGDDNYTISIFDYDNGREDIVIAENLPITKAIEPGMTETVNFKIEGLTVSNPTEMTTLYLAIRENMTNKEFGRGFENAIKVKYKAPDVQPAQALTITAAELQTETFTDGEGNTCVVADADGNYTLTYNVTVKNSGTDPLTVGTEGYSIQLTSASGFGYAELGDPVDITVDLQPEEETTVEYTVVLNRQETYQVTPIFRENLGQTTFETNQTITPADDPTIEKRELTIDHVENKTATRNEFSGFSFKTYTDTDADGNFTIEADVTLKNTGNVTLTDDEVLITLYNNADETQVFATAKMGRDLEAGQSVTVNLKAELNIADVSGTITYYVKENVTNTSEYVVSTEAFKKETTLDVAIGEDGWASFCSDKALSFANCEGLTAYVVTSVEGGSAKLAEVTEVPAYTGVLLQGAEGTYTADILDNAEAPEENMLRGTVYAQVEVTESEWADAPYGSTYVFGKDKNGNIGFVKASVGYVIPQWKAYLIYSEGTAEARQFISLDGDVATSIGHLTQSGRDSQAYSLQGQKVSAAYKGIVIRNGRKMINK